MNVYNLMAIIISSASGLIGALILVNLKTLTQSIAKMDKRIDGQDKKIEKLIERKNFCNQDFVGKVDYIRSVNSLEGTMKKLLESVSELKGTMEVVRQMPQICGNIAREIAKEMSHEH